MFFSLNRFGFRFSADRPERGLFSAGKRGRALRFEELEERRLLSADAFLAGAFVDTPSGAGSENAQIAAAVNTESALLPAGAITNAITLYANESLNATTNTYTLSITASLNPTSLTTPYMYLDIFFSSVGLNKVSQDALRGANSSYNLVVNTETLLVPSLTIANLSRFQADYVSVTLFQDTGTNTDGSDSTDWYLRFFWNNSTSNLRFGQSAPFKLVDLALPISEDAAGFAGRLEFNFALRNSDSSWTVCYQNPASRLSETPTPHYQIQLPGSECLDAPGNLHVTGAVSWNRFGVSWNPVTGASGYAVGWKRSGSTDGYTESAVLTGTEFSLTGLSGGTQYQVAVRAVTATGAGNSGWSAVVTKTTPKDTPYDITPLAVTISEMTEIDTSIVELRANDSNPAHINTMTFTLSTNEQRQVDSDYFEIQGTKQNSVWLKKRAAVGIYELWVTAKDAAGFESSPAKLVITVAQAPQACVNAESITVLSGCCFFLSGSGSLPSPGQSVTGYYWDLNGDGRPDRTAQEFYASVSELGSPNSNGIRTVDFWVSDSAGWTSAKTSIPITIVDRAETIRCASVSLFDGEYLKLCVERFNLQGTAVSSWKILWDAQDDPSGAEWDRAESFDTNASRLRAVHYYAPQAQDAVYSVRLRLVAADKTIDFKLADHFVAGTALNGSLVETAAPTEDAPAQTVCAAAAFSDRTAPESAGFTLVAPIVLFNAKSRFESTLESLSRPNDSGAFLEETFALEPLAAEFPAAELPIAEFTAVLWENRVDAATLHDLALNDDTESESDAELTETLETVFSARRPSLPDD